MFLFLWRHEHMAVNVALAAARHHYRDKSATAQGVGAEWFTIFDETSEDARFGVPVSDDHASVLQFLGESLPCGQRDWWTIVSFALISPSDGQLGASSSCSSSCVGWMKVCQFVIS